MSQIFKSYSKFKISTKTHKKHFTSQHIILFQNLTSQSSTVWSQKGGNIPFLCQKWDLFYWNTGFFFKIFFEIILALFLGVYVNFS